MPVGATAAFIAILITVYFWWRNTQGLHESSDDAMRIMKVTTVMVVLMIGWCALTLLWRGGGQLPPAPLPRNMQFSDDALGWLKGTIWPGFTAIAILVGFGHSILAMSGEESLAQVYREIEHPKVQEPEARGDGHLRLQPAVHLARELLCRRDHPRRGSAAASTTT